MLVNAPGDLKKSALTAASAEFHHDHLFVDDDGRIKDSHIENMFDDLFYGHQLDSIFRNNFRQYYGMLASGDSNVPDYVFDNVTKSNRWLSKRFGKLEISAAQHDDPDLAHCHARAVFVQPQRFPIPAVYAPSKLYAGLLAAVTVFRHLAQIFNDERFIPTPGEIN